jgi:hypothetical protein
MATPASFRDGITGWNADETRLTAHGRILVIKIAVATMAIGARNAMKKVRIFLEQRRGFIPHRFVAYETLIR